MICVWSPAGPCCVLLSLHAGRVEVKVTTASSAIGPWLKNSAGFGILPLSQCPNTRCRPAGKQPLPPTVGSDLVWGPGDAPSSSAESRQDVLPPKPGSKKQEQQQGKAPAADATAAGSNTSSNTSSSTSDSAVLASGSGAAAGVINSVATAAELTGMTNGPKCVPSSLGYTCSARLAEGVVLHYSNGGKAPHNACTNTTSVDKALRNATNLLHFALESELPVRFGSVHVESWIYMSALGAVESHGYESEA